MTDGTEHTFRSRRPSLFEFYTQRLTAGESPRIVRPRTWRSAMTRRRFVALDVRGRRFAVAVGRGR